MCPSHCGKGLKHTLSRYVSAKASSYSSSISCRSDARMCCILSVSARGVIVGIKINLNGQCFYFRSTTVEEEWEICLFIANYLNNNQLLALLPLLVDVVTTPLCRGGGTFPFSRLFKSRCIFWWTIIFCMHSYKLQIFCYSMLLMFYQCTFLFYQIQSDYCTWHFLPRWLPRKNKNFPELNKDGSIMAFEGNSIAPLTLQRYSVWNMSQAITFAFIFA